MENASKEKIFYLLTSNCDWADEHNVPALAVMTEKEFKIWSESKLKFNAFLGNNGDGFLEEFQGKTGKSLLKAGLVNKYKVDKNFVKFFKKADLEDLSLTDIFCPEYIEDGSDEDGEEELFID